MKTGKQFAAELLEKYGTRDPLAPAEVGKGARRGSWFDAMDQIKVKLPANTARADELVQALREQAGYGTDPKPAKKTRKAAA